MAMDKTHIEPEVSIQRGADVPRTPTISVIVLSVDSDTRASDAIESLLSQDDETLEVVAVNTGVGSLKSALTEVLPCVVLVESATKRFAGGARNLGVANATAPIIAFLAADCVAGPGWIRARISAHREHEAIANSLRPTPVTNSVARCIAWAAYLSTHFSRMPEVLPEFAGYFGVSYSRRLLDTVGAFNESLRIGEDSEFNVRVRSIASIAWRPDIITYHRYPTRLFDAIKDQLERGALQAAYHKKRGISSTKYATVNAKIAVKYFLHIAKRGRNDFAENPIGSNLLSLAFGLLRSAGAFASR